MFLELVDQFNNSNGYLKEAERKQQHHHQLIRSNQSHPKWMKTF